MITRTDRLPSSRRQFLRSAGVLLALPALESFRLRAAVDPAPPQRFLAIQTTQGIMPHLFFPKESGRGNTGSPYLEILAPLKDSFTVFSGLSHPGVDGGHANEVCFLTGAPHPGSGGFRNRISIDQVMASRLGTATRFPFLATAVSTSPRRSMSFNQAGVGIPPDYSAAQLYRKLFINGTPAEVEARVEELRNGRSLLDQHRERIRQMNRDLPATDRDTLGRYLTALRELEERLLQSEAWVRKPKPKPSNPGPPDNIDSTRILENWRTLLNVLALALETDSTRVATVFLEPLGILQEVEGVQRETHSLTHHGNRPEMMRELRRIEEAQFRILRDFLLKLRETTVSGLSLLDQTAVLYGTCMGNANGHSNSNWPMLLAGGGFRHGHHLAFDTQHNQPIGKLFASILDWMNMDADGLPSGSHLLKGLDRRPA